MLDHSTNEILRTRLRLLTELTVTPQVYGGSTWYHLEVPGRGAFYRVGPIEYAFISLLDGHTSVAHAISLVAQEFGRDALTEQEAVSICRWVLDSALAEPEGSVPGAIEEQLRRKKTRASLGRANPLFLKCPLFNPDRVLRLASKSSGWLLSGRLFPVWLAIVAAGVIALSRNWNRFVAATDGFLAVDNWIWIGVMWLVLKVVHEFAHGLACRRYGGEVREMGVVLILFAPLAYVDLTSAWRLTSKWQRIHTALAGMYVELAVAGLAALVWERTDNVEVAFHCVNLIVMASVTTVLFNANPLMRFDGYYVLSDMLGLPNLYARGTKCVQQLARRLVLGSDRSGMSTIRHEPLIVHVYGVASFAWRIVICVGLVVAAAAMFHGAGIVVAVFAVGAWIGIPALRGIRRALTEYRNRPGQFIRSCVRAGMLASGFAAVLLLAPWPGGRTAPGVVAYEPVTVMRAETAGFVRDIRVHDGQMVDEGAELLRLTNDELEVEYRQLQSRIAESRTRQRRLTQRSELAAVQAEQENEAALRKQFIELSLQREHLVLRAPHAGRIVARRLDDLSGTWIAEGDTLLLVANEDQKELQLAIGQNDVDAFRARVGRPVTWRVPGRKPLRASLIAVTPRGERTPRHQALCATVGGPVPVKPISDEDAEAEFEFTEAHFTGRVRLPEDVGAAVAAGRRGWVDLDSGDRRLGPALVELLARWFEAKAKQAGLN